MKSMVLITGASGGIGRALAHQLHSQGLLVAVVGRDADPLADVTAASRITADTTTPEGAALQGGSGAAVIASSVVARIGVANHEAIAAAKGRVSRPWCAARQPTMPLKDCASTQLHPA